MMIDDELKKLTHGFRIRVAIALAAFVVCWLALTGLVMSAIDRAGGLQCWLAPMWNQNQKPAGCP